MSLCVRLRQLSCFRKEIWKLMSGKTNISPETGLVFLVPEAEDVTALIRRRHDPSAALGMPAHITVLYPFLLPSDIDDDVLGELRRCLVEFSAFRFSLGELRQFTGNVLYLAPDPAKPFEELTSAICSCFPQTPPYGRKHRDIVPHLTLGMFSSAAELEGAARAFQEEAAMKVPIRAKAARVSLMSTSPGGWRVADSFDLR